MRDTTQKHHKYICIPSANTILRGNVELSVQCDYIKTPSGKAKEINMNSQMNAFMVYSAIKFNQLNPKDKGITYDFNHQFIVTNII